MKIRSNILSAFVLLLACSVTAWGQEEKREFMVYDASNGLADNNAQIVTCTPSGRIMVSTLGHINFFTGGGFIHIDPKASDASPLPGYAGGYQLAFDRFNHLWIKNDHMMTCLDLTTEKFVSDIPALCKKMGVKGQVDDFFGDGESNVWFRTGRQLYSPHLKKTIAIHSDAVLQEVDVCQDTLLLMFHADCSVVTADLRTGRMLRHDKAFNDDYAMRYSNFSEVCLMGHHYFQIRNGEVGSLLLSYNINTHVWSKVMENKFQMNALHPRGNLLYIGTSTGYFIFNSRTGESRLYDNIRLTKGRTSVPHITSLAFDLQGGMWIGTEQRGLLYDKPFHSPFKKYQKGTPEANYYLTLLNSLLDENAGKGLGRKINCVFTDSRGWKWTGSYFGLELSKPDGTTQVFNRKSGMPNEVVHSIAEDQQHDIWMSTSFGISHLYIRDGEVYHIEPYTNQDDVPNESFVNGRSVTLADGTIIMESIDHLVTFNPEHFQGSAFGNIPIKPYLIHLSINGNEIEAGEEIDGKVILDKAVSCTERINVNYNQNSLSLIFSTQNYLRPIQTYYRVRIKGIPEYENWRIMSYGRSDGMVDKYGLLHLPLQNLTPGLYKIEMQVSMWPERWTEDVAVWEINIEQPWWRTTGVYLSLGLVAMILLILNVVLYNRNLRLSIMRHDGEQEVLRRVKNYASRCKSLQYETLDEDGCALITSEVDALSPAFVDAMLRIVPYVNQPNQRYFTMSELAGVARVANSYLYDMFIAHLDTNPRLLMLPLRLQETATQLRSTDMSIEEIAQKNRFASANIFISAFYHRYRQTPQQYRS